MAVQGGKIIFREWKSDSGLSEVEQTFSSLEELYEKCINAHDPLLVDRVVIDGNDDEGNQRILTLVFQSVKISKD